MIVDFSELLAPARDRSLEVVLLPVRTQEDFEELMLGVDCTLLQNAY